MRVLLSALAAFAFATTFCSPTAQATTVYFDISDRAGFNKTALAAFSGMEQFS
jgi:hypothetical protein